jgi:hypothetical protein
LVRVTFIRRVPIPSFETSTNRGYYGMRDDPLNYVYVSVLLCFPSLNYFSSISHYPYFCKIFRRQSVVCNNNVILMETGKFDLLLCRYTKYTLQHSKSNETANSSSSISDNILFPPSCRNTLSLQSLSGHSTRYKTISSFEESYFFPFRFLAEYCT